MNKLRFIILSLLLVLSCRTNAAMSVDIDKQMAILAQGETPPSLISNAKFRVAVFTYEDPDKTGLGNAIASLVAHEILMNSGVRSLGVIRFEGRLSPDDKYNFSYFDKVESITAAQQVSLSVWGNIRRIKDELLIDTYVQIPKASLQKYCTKKLTLPKKMGGKDLIVQMQPDRFAVQRLVIPINKGRDFIWSARKLTSLRESANERSKPIGKIPQDRLHYFTRRSGDWVQISIKGGKKGWIPIRGHCRGACKSLVNAAKFAGSVEAYMAHSKSVIVTKGLTTEALAIKEQVMALKGYSRKASISNAKKSLHTAQRWVGTKRMTGLDKSTAIKRGSAIPPGGAGFANIKAIADIAIALKESKATGKVEWRQIELPIEKVKNIAFELAEASQNDPNNKIVLHNLAVLFEYIGDSKRANLALKLADDKY